MKNPILVVSLVLLLCFTFGCQNKAEKAELERFRTQAKLEEQNKEIVKRFFEEFNKGNMEIFNELCVPDYSFYFPSNNPKPMSREEQIEQEKMNFRNFPDLNLRIDKLFADGDTVIVWFIITGTHQGEWEGIPATGNKLEIRAIEIYRIENGKIVETRQEADYLGLMQQLGMELKPIEAKKK
jgi:steroid delta-isomerase-like uncharacterized protein